MSGYPRALSDVTLDDKYTLSSGRVFMSGTQALVRLMLLQAQRDALAGLHTNGFVSGYRGSPLGGVDQALWKARPYLDKAGVVFQPGVNEDLAATAVWGTQQVNLFPGAKVDGVFAMWYGKGPGVDRSGDVFRHANAAGTSRHGGVLAIAGDDHAAKSSTLPHQTDHFFKSMMMPVLAPAGVQEYLDYGIHGWALSRYSGCWVAFKALADTVETSASVEVDPLRVQVTIPTDFELPPDGLNIRWPDPPLVQEKRLLHFKLYAALAYCRANGLNRLVIDPPKPRLGIITSGKSYLDVRQALEDLGIDERGAAEIGIRLYKVGMVWPLEAEGVRRFADGLEEILVIEEKRQLLEYQLKEELYNWREDVRPRVVGKFDEKGEWAHIEAPSGLVDHGTWLLPAAGDLTPAMIARAIAARIARFHTSPRIEKRLAWITAKEEELASKSFAIDRIPTFCPGCPHNTSTKVPEGSRAVGGIGCHYMVTWMHGRNTSTFTQMGGEGVTWVGQAPFTRTPHVFANLGDGTYFHSGLLAIRQAVAAFNCQPSVALPKEGGDGGSLRAGTSADPALGRPGGGAGITYKILYNDAVAMTGGQPVDGTITVPMIVNQVAAEGVHNIVVVTDGSPRHYGRADLPHGVPIRHRDELDAIQREFRELPGVSAIVYDQTCAAEKRRRRKRGKFADPARRMVINPHVCEGCGDCGVQSNCMAILPLETPLGRKRIIDQSACNKDYSCAKGFCPSFVSVVGGQLKKGKAGAAGFDESTLPTPALPDIAKPWGILVTGVGGTGVMTIGALIGMAAHLDGHGVTVLDMAGLAQKGGAVYSHIRIAGDPAVLHAVRVAAGEADVLIGGDLIVSASDEAIAKMAVGKTRAVVNSALSPTSEFAHDPDWSCPDAKLRDAIGAAIGGEVDFVDMQQLALTLMGDTIAGNLMLLGFAWQRGLVPVSHEALMRAIDLNGVAVAMNRRAFAEGRRIAAEGAPVTAVSPPLCFDDVLSEGIGALTAYQDHAYAERFRIRAQAAERAGRAAGIGDFGREVAQSLRALMAIKDEYEVARLYTETDFLDQVAQQFEGDYALHFHMAPPLLARPDASGQIAKQEYGPWMWQAMKRLAGQRHRRGTALDLFGRTAERRGERARLADFERDVDALLARLAALDERGRVAALELAALPRRIRGFGHVKQRNAEQVAPRWQALRVALGLV